MDWQKLELGKADLVKKEVDGVLERITEYLNNPIVQQAMDHRAVVESVQARIHQLEDFYLAHSSDERAILFEKERLRLRKALQSLNNYNTNNNNNNHYNTNNTVSSMRDTRSISAPLTAERVSDQPQAQVQPLRSTANFESTNASIRGNNNNRTGPQESAFFPAETNSIKARSVAPSVANRSMTSSVRKNPPPIYSWEEKTEKPRREEVAIDGIVFSPTPVAGLYARNFHNDESDDFLSDRFIDFQVLLSHEEMLTLAARKKADKQDVKLVKNTAAATSVHNATPYVDPKRILQEMLRPGQPDKWMHTDNLRPNAKW